MGAIRSWDFGAWRYPVIIDNLMNLELLFRAAGLGQAPRFAELGLTHAKTTLANHFRANGSSYHVVDYDPETGGVIQKQTHQGLADESAWARGQAWALYGCTMLYRESGQGAFLEQAQRIAAFYTEHPNMPADGVPYFDFDAPRLAPDLAHRDISPGSHGHFLLKHSVGNQPSLDEVDVAINYADYYFLEALLRCKG